MRLWSLLGVRRLPLGSGWRGEGGEREGRGRGEGGRGREGGEREGRLRGRGEGGEREGCRYQCIISTFFVIPTLLNQESISYPQRWHSFN